MQSWEKGVELELHGVGTYRTVRSTEDAAQCLLAYWPTGKGKAYQMAQQACLEALGGAASPESAREAFIAAALAAKIHIRSFDDPRAVAMGNTIATDSEAFRKANHRAMEAVRKTAEKIKAERERVTREDDDQR